MEQVGLYNAASVQQNTNLNSKATLEPSKLETDTDLKSEEQRFSPEASDALKAQVLYKKQDEKQQYLSDCMDKGLIVHELKNKNKMKRSFLGYKSRIANIITKAQDPSLAMENFNYLMNYKNNRGKTLNTPDIVEILAVATIINNDLPFQKTANKLNKKLYGFEGGKLDNKSVERILKEVDLRREKEAIRKAKLKGNRYSANGISSF